MDQHLGASIPLSFALVVMFAIILYQPEHPPLPASSAGVTVVKSTELEPIPLPIPDLPAVTPGEALVTTPTRQGVPAVPASTPEKAIPPLQRPELSTARRSTLDRITRGSGKGPPSLTASVPGEARPFPLPSAPNFVATSRRQPAEIPDHEAFTLVNEGETLKDVAVRIYGSAEEVDSLWRLNRDLIGRWDVTLPVGTLLRTP